MKTLNKTIKIIFKVILRILAIIWVISLVGIFCFERNRDYFSGNLIFTKNEIQEIFDNDDWDNSEFIGTIASKEQRMSSNVIKIFEGIENFEIYERNPQNRFWWSALIKIDIEDIEDAYIKFDLNSWSITPFLFSVRNDNFEFNPFFLTEKVFYTSNIKCLVTQWFLPTFENCKENNDEFADCFNIVSWIDSIDNWCINYVFNKRELLWYNDLYINLLTNSGAIVGVNFVDKE